MLSYLVSKCPRCFSLAASNTKLMCTANASFAQVGNYNYDRHSVMKCSADLVPFRQGEKYTSISFLGPHKETWYPMPDMGRPEGMFPMHVNWRMYYVPADGEESRTTIYQQEDVWTDKGPRERCGTSDDDDDDDDDERRRRRRRSESRAV